MAKMAGFWTSAAAICAVAMPLWAEGETSATVVATVNGVEITLGQMVALRESLPDQYQNLPDDVLFKAILDQLIQQEAVSQSVTTQTARDEANILNDRRAYLSGIVIEEVVKSAVTDEALQAAYDAKFKDA
ncbi:MAG: peptidylprolyl isomerase, partial [Tabrizicola sp.]